MKKNQLIMLLVILLIAPASFAQQKIQEGREKTQQVLEKVANRILSETTYQFVDTETGKTYKTTKGLPPKTSVKVESRYNDWHYTNGVLNFAMNELGDLLGEKKYNEFVDKNFDFVFNHGDLDYFKKLYDKEKKTDWYSVRKVNWHMFFRMIRLDDCGTIGASLIEVYKHDKNEGYKKYIDQVAHHLMTTEPRLADGTISRYWPHENTIWADDLYMSVAFLARMGELTGESKYFDDAIHQIKQYHHYLWGEPEEVFYHCYHTDILQNGVAHWARANGWVFMAQADLLEVLPADYPGREEVLAIFQRQAEGLARCQSESGLWHQLLDKNDSYLETSATAMFVFGMARGVNKGWLDQDFSYVADMGWNGILTKIDEKGDVHDICVGTGIMPSLSFYYKRPVATSIPMGEGPVLRAGAEILQMQKYHELPARTKYDRILKEAEGK